MVMCDKTFISTFLMTDGYISMSKAGPKDLTPKVRVGFSNNSVDLLELVNDVLERNGLICNRANIITTTESRESRTGGVVKKQRHINFSSINALEILNWCGQLIYKEDKRQLCLELLRLRNFVHVMCGSNMRVISLPDYMRNIYIERGQEIFNDYIGLKGN